MRRIKSTKTQFYLWNIGWMIHILKIHETKCSKLISFRDFNLLIHYPYRQHPFCVHFLHECWNQSISSGFFREEQFRKIASNHISIVVSRDVTWFLFCEECDVDLRICFVSSNESSSKKECANTSTTAMRRLNSAVGPALPPRIANQSFECSKTKHWTPSRNSLENRI